MASDRAVTSDLKKKNEKLKNKQEKLTYKRSSDLKKKNEKLMKKGKVEEKRKT